MKSSTLFLSVCSILLITTPLEAADNLQNQLLERDRGLWTAWGNAEGDVFKRSLTKDAVQVVAGTGVLAGRQAIVAEVSKNECRLNSFEFTNASVRRVAPNVALLSYTATQDAVCGTDKLPPKVQVTSIYVRKKGKWLSTSYQETPIE